jgi:hypothetical protein
MAAIADELDGEETVGEGFGGLDWKGGECPLLLGLLWLAWLSELGLGFLAMACYLSDSTKDALME